MSDSEDRLSGKDLRDQFRSQRDGFSSEIRKALDEGMKMLEEERKKCFQIAIDEIYTTGHLSGFDDKLERVSRLFGSMELDDAQRADSAVAFASLYPTFGDVKELGKAWNATKNLREIKK
mgnify:FL=1